LIREHEDKLTVSLPQEPMYLEGDQTRLAQVLSNLLNNAGKYSERGSPIWLTARAEAKDIVISVRDVGVGIRGPMLDRIFGMSVQVDKSPSKSQGGIGRWANYREADRGNARPPSRGQKPGQRQWQRIHHSASGQPGARTGSRAEDCRPKIRNGPA